MYTQLRSGVIGKSLCQHSHKRSYSGCNQRCNPIMRQAKFDKWQPLQRGSHVLELERFRRRPSWLFVITVLLPTAISCIYFGVLAGDIYVSESQFVVRSPKKSTTGGLSGLLQSAGFSNDGEELYTARAFATSRDALLTLNRNDAYEKKYTRPDIHFVDRFNPLGIWSSFEDLYKYFQSHVRVDADPTTSISTLTVRAYTAEDAYRINSQLLAMSEATINEINDRGQSDLVRYAKGEVAAAKKQAEEAAIELARFRNRSGIVDPEKQAEIQMQMISKLQDELISSKVQLAQLRSFAPDNPQIPAMNERISTIKDEISNQLGIVTGGSKSLASSSVEFQRRLLENELAEKQLASALASLEDAKNEARRQQVYVERIVAPNMPDAPTEPRRLRGVLATMAIGIAAWGILSMLLAGVREHAN